MDLIDRAYDTYQQRSAAASAIARQLCFAGIALIWVFKIEEEGNPRVEPALVMPALLFGLALLFDLLHYVVGGILWGTFHRGLERKKQRNEALPKTAPGKINWPGNSFFGAKIILVVVSYGFIVVFLARKAF